MLQFPPPPSGFSPPRHPQRPAAGQGQVRLLPLGLHCSSVTLVRAAVLRAGSAFLGSQSNPLAKGLVAESGPSWSPDVLPPTEPAAPASQGLAQSWGV